MDAIVFGVTSQDLVDALIRGLANGGLYAIVGVGLIIIFSTTNVFNFAHGELLMAGAMISLTLIGFGAPYILALIAGIIAAGLFGLLEEQIAIARVKSKGRVSDESEDALVWLLSTMGFALIAQNLAQWIWGVNFKRFPPVLGSDPINLLGTPIVPQLLLLFLTGILFIFILEVFYRRTLLGKALKATAEQPMAAQLRGINSRKMAVIAFAIGGMAAGLAGVLIAPISFAGWAMGVPLGIKGFVAAALGGLRRTDGALVGGMILGLTESTAIVFIDAAFRDTIALLVLLVIALVRPGGILGEPLGRRV